MIPVVFVLALFVYAGLGLVMFLGGVHGPSFLLMAGPAYFLLAVVTTATVGIRLHDVQSASGVARYVLICLGIAVTGVVTVALSGMSVFARGY